MTESGIAPRATVTETGQETEPRVIATWTTIIAEIGETTAMIGIGGIRCTIETRGIGHPSLCMISNVRSGTEENQNTQ